MARLLACSTLLAASAAALAATHVDPFETGNPTGWRFIQGADVIQPVGGNPGAWLNQPVYDTFAPILDHTNLATPFSGDYRAMGVTKITIDAQTISTQFPAAGLPFTLLLADTKGTADPADDDYVYYVDYSGIPVPGEGWVHFEFDVPSQADALPPGWSGGHFGDMESFRPGVGWTDVIQSVDRVEFWWIHPAWFAIFQQWNVGADNIAIVTAPPCPGDIDGDGVVGQSDLGVLLAAFGTCDGDPAYNAAADLDGDGCVGQTDLGALLSHFGTNCR